MRWAAAVLVALLFPHPLTGAVMSELDQFGCTAGQMLRQNAAGTAEECFTPGSGGTNEWTIIKKTADTIRSNTTTLTADPHLTLGASILAPDTRVYSRWFIWYGTTADSDIDYIYDSTGTEDYEISSAGASGPGNDLQTDFAGPGLEVGYSRRNLSGDCTDFGPILFSGPSGVRFRGYIFCEWALDNNGTANSLTFTWAQNTPSAFDTIVYAGSYIEYRVLCTGC